MHESHAGDAFRRRYHTSAVCLWRGVIAQHIIDAASLSNKPCNIKWKDEAKRWLFSPEEHTDLEHVCTMAGVCMYTIRDIARHYIDKRRKKAAIKRTDTHDERCVLQSLLFDDLPFDMRPKQSKRNTNRKRDSRPYQPSCLPYDAPKATFTCDEARNMW